MLVKFLTNNNYKKKNFAGRNNKGRICVRHRGPFLKKNFFKKKLIDFKRFLPFNNFFIVSIEKTLKSNFFIALCYACFFGVFFYILLPYGLFIGSLLKNYNLNKKKPKISCGFSAPLIKHSLGSFIFNINIFFLKKKSFCQSAGSFARIFKFIILPNLKTYVCIKLPSGSLYYLKASNNAVCGTNANILFKFFKKLSARSLRLKGRRPRVRGVAMNPVDHPHGGGEGKTSGGRVSVSKWGLLAKGGVTLTLKKKKKKKN